MNEAGLSPEALIARVQAARARLADAAASASLPEVAGALDELEEAHGLAREAGVDVPREVPRQGAGAEETQS